jgi:hypothetical protein
MMAARIVSSGTRIDAETPSVLFDLPAAALALYVGSSPWYAVARDGKAFLLTTAVEGASPITVLLNWKPGN